MHELHRDVGLVGAGHANVERTGDLGAGHVDVELDGDDALVVLVLLDFVLVVAALRVEETRAVHHLVHPVDLTHAVDVHEALDIAADVHRVDVLLEVPEAVVAVGLPVLEVHAEAVLHLGLAAVLDLLLHGGDDEHAFVLAVLLHLDLDDGILDAVLGGAGGDAVVVEQQARHALAVLAELVADLVEVGLILGVHLGLLVGGDGVLGICGVRHGGLLLVDGIDELLHELRQFLRGNGDVVHVLALVAEVDEKLLAGLVLGTVGGRHEDELVIHGDGEHVLFGIHLDGHAELGEGLADGTEVGFLLVDVGVLHFVLLVDNVSFETGLRAELLRFQLYLEDFHLD